MKFAKVKTAGLTQWDKTEAAMQQEHDKAVKSYSKTAAQAALDDLAPRTGNNRDPEWRWIRHRRAALQRLLFAPELCRA
jgi:hypothetical protein